MFVFAATISIRFYHFDSITFSDKKNLFELSGVYNRQLVQQLLHSRIISTYFSFYISKSFQLLNHLVR